MTKMSSMTNTHMYLYPWQSNGMIKMLNLTTKKGLPLFGRSFEEHLNPWVSVYEKQQWETEKQSEMYSDALRTMRISRSWSSSEVELRKTQNADFGRLPREGRSRAKRKRKGRTREGCHLGCAQGRHHVALLSAAPNVTALLSVLKMPYRLHGLCGDIFSVISAGKNSAESVMGSTGFDPTDCKCPHSANPFSSHGYQPVGLRTASLDTVGAAWDTLPTYWTSFSATGQSWFLC